MSLGRNIAMGVTGLAALTIAGQSFVFGTRSEEGPYTYGVPKFQYAQRTSVLAKVLGYESRQVLELHPERGNVPPSQASVWPMIRYSTPTLSSYNELRNKDGDAWNRNRHLKDDLMGFPGDLTLALLTLIVAGVIIPQSKDAKFRPLVKEL